MKVIFDSNVHISAVVFGGAAARAVNATVDARWRIYVCETILSETVRIIRDRFNGSNNLAAATEQTLRKIGRFAEETPSRHHVPGDSNDTPILRAALTAGVDHLVTRDAALLTMNPVEGVRIITLAEYLHILQDHGYALD